MQNGMTIKDFLYLIKRRILMISVTAIIVIAVTSFVVFFLIRPAYEANQYILIGNLQNTNIENSYEETQKIPQMLASSVDFIKSPIVLNAVKKELDLKGVSLEEKLVIKNNKDSQIITITVKDREAELARKIAATTAMISIEKMNTLLKFNQVKILEKNDDLVKENNIAAVMAISLVIGIFSGVGLAVMREQLDDSIKTERIVENVLGVPLLGKFDGKVMGRKRGKGTYLYQEHGKERRKFSAKEEKSQVDRATSIS